ncbi:hypothetical protein Agabi119p4_5337 [Agaricus bisporus var. burnettii]|uniref:Uncharacterized protein n=1 Tax=Agaricus bisporus var. burnettii TaxID=192524 RepID=A0A8H7KG28_AGABI|nr:hypothetical protein Agabi119p4_5337 [Agaricus bisporus var. burnettii]
MIVLNILLLEMYQRLGRGKAVHCMRITIIVPARSKAFGQTTERESMTVTLAQLDNIFSILQSRLHCHGHRKLSWLLARLSNTEKS